MPLFDLFLERGKTQRKLNNLEGSIADISRCLEFQKYNSKPKIMASAYNELGLSLFQKNLLEESIERFSKAIEFDSENGSYFNNRGQAQAALHRPLLVFQDFNKALSINPYDPTVLHNRGIAYVVEKKFEEAHLDFDLAIQKKPEEAIYFFSKGRAYFLEKRFKEAEESFRACLDLDGENVQTLYELALTLDHLGKFEEGMSCLNGLLKMVPMHHGANQARGIIYQKLGSHKFALEDFELALNLDPTNAVITFLKGKSLLELGKYQMSIDNFTKAMELNFNEIDIYKCFAKAYESLNNLEKSLYYLNYGLKREPTHADFLLERSNLNVKMSNFQSALSDLDKILVDQPKNAFINFKLGTVYFQNKDYQRTLESMSASLETGELVLANQSEAYFIMGLSLASLEQFSDAKDNFSKAVELDFEKAVYHHERAKCYLMIDDYLSAIEGFNQTIERQPMNANAYFGRGFAYKNILEFRKSVGLKGGGF